MPFDLKCDSIMDSPTVVTIPPPPPGKTGWPWTVERRLSPHPLPDGSNWPRVTIVTPSFNQGGFIEETIRSVLLQDYPDLEYLIIDGGSSDDTVQIIKKYEPWIHYWVSEPDRGQSHAINKGFERAQGEIVAWLNSDDTYEPHAIEIAVRHMVTRHAAIVYGNCNLVDQAGVPYQVVVPPAVTLDSLLRFWINFSTPPQPAIFFRRQVLEAVGLLDESLHYVMDYELWVRIARKYPFSYFDAAIGNYRMQRNSKTVSALDRMVRERYQVGRRHCAHEGLRYR